MRTMLHRTSIAKGGSRLVRGAQLLRFNRAGFITSAPSPQTALDAAPDAWVSRFPPPLDGLQAGKVELFNDDRMHWAFERMGGLEGKTVLELGPLEAGHSYMAQAAGASHLTAIEANRNAFLKCLVTKELLGLDRCSFQCGDVLEYMSASTETFDVAFATGILYHMVEPIRLLDLLSQRCSQIVIWTQVFDERGLANQHFARRIGPAIETEYKGFRHHVHRYDYGVHARLAGFSGGTRPYTNWLPREDLLRALEHFGWSDVEIGFDEPTSHPHGPALALVASRRP
jgi:hypothetical protein